jgi:hypothetical protein
MQPASKQVLCVICTANLRLLRLQSYRLKVMLRWTRTFTAPLRALVTFTVSQTASILGVLSYSELSYLLITEAEHCCCTWWSHSRTHINLVVLLWTIDRPIAKPSTWQHTSFTRGRHPQHRRDSNPHSQQASGRRPMPETARPPESASAFVTK